MISFRTKDWVIDNVETVVFDKDGTFVDLHYFWGKITELRAKAVIKKYNLSEEDINKICLFLGFDYCSGKMAKDGITALYSRIKIIEIFTQNLFEMGVKASEKDIEKIFDEVTCLFNEKLFDYVKPIMPAIEFIKKLKERGLRLGVLTSDSVLTTELTLKYFGWNKLFDVVIGRESTNFTKESGEPMKILLEKINANPKTTVMVGDAPMDYLAAKNAGVDNVILVASGQIEKNDLLQTINSSVDTICDIEIV